MKALHGVFPCGLLRTYYPSIGVICGPGSSVSIVADYGLDGPGSKPIPRADVVGESRVCTVQ